MAVRTVDASGTGTTYATMTITPLSQIAFDAGGRIVVANSDGSNQTILTDAAAAFPAYSPDGSKIAFYSDLSGSGDIYVMNADGSDTVNITYNLPAPDTVRYGRPAWSPDGSKIAFVMTGGDPGTYIGVMNADGSGLTQLTFPVTCGPRTCYGTEADPTWSPDGTRIAFGHLAAIWVMNADGSNQMALTDETAIFALQPSWSPDGTRIAFAGSIAGGAGADEKVYVMRADGALMKNVTSNLLVPGSYPAWSPDGTRIAFVEAVNYFDRSHSDGQIGVIRADGSQWTELSPRGNRPSWTRGCPSR
jgi:Tol biopolymer transport system component